MRGLLLKDTGGQLRHFGGRKGRRRSADAETFDILLEADEGHFLGFYVLDEVQDSSLNGICVEKGGGQFEGSREEKSTLLEET